VNDDVSDLIRELAVEHGVALDRSDPIVVLHTATRRIVEGVLREAQQAQTEALKQHRSELESAAAKWQQDSKLTASQFLQHVPMSIAAGVSAELHKAASAAVLQLDQALERHNKVLARATLTCALSAAVALLAAATFVWASHRASNRPETSRAEMACVAGQPACN
jgi:hypothetical protein